MSAHIVIVTGAHLCRNPRVVKEAEALADVGYRVTVLRPVFSQDLADLDAELAAGAGWTVQTTVNLAEGRLRPLLERLTRRLASEAVRRGAEPPDALGYGVRRTLRLARTLDADLTIGHQEVGLWVANRLAEAGRCVGVDIEDWYSEDLPPANRQSRATRLLRREEAVAIRRGGHVTTTTDALARALQREFGGEAPTTVYNAFPWSDRRTLDGETQDRKGEEEGRLSLHWVSQTIGTGRGLEEVVDALADVAAPVALHLRGYSSPEVEAALRHRLRSDSPHRIVLHDPVPPRELLSRIAEHDVGLALELGASLNNNLTASNKIHHYLLAGLPVIASDTAGQQEVATKAPDAVVTFPAGDVPALARAISGFASRAALERASVAALDAARREFHWEHQRQSLVASVETALAAPYRG